MYNTHSQFAERVYKCNMELTYNNLISWTSGNVSGRLREEETGVGPDRRYTATRDLMVIKPSGVRYEDLKPDQMPFVSLKTGEVTAPVVFPMTTGGVEKILKPSTDTESHLYIYKHCPEVNGICHTHSPYATAFAAAGMYIPCILTAMADEFGNSIFCTKTVSEIGSEAIGRDVVDYLGLCANSGAVLLKSHGVFTVGPSPEAAVKTAVMVEDAARTVWLSLQLQLHSGKSIQILPLDVIEANYDRYHSTYGQK